MSAPKLRFPEYGGEWEEKKLGDNLQATTGGGTPSRKIANYWNGDIPWASVKDFNDKKFRKNTLESITEEGLKNSSSNLIPKDNLIISTRMGLGKGFINKIPISINQDLKGLIPNADIDVEFLYYWYKRKSDYIETLGKGSTVKGLRLEELHSLTFTVPLLKEQQKIASFLSKVDEKIEKLEKKQQLWETYKKGMMQQIFSLKLRFKDENGEDYSDWEEKKLNEIVKRVTRKNNNLESDLPLTISAQHGLIDQISFFNKIVASKSLKGYYLLKKDEFAYNKSYSSGYPWGVIKRLDKYEQGVLSTLYICFSLKGDVDSDFLVQYFSSNNWYQEIYNIAVEGARNHGLLNISVNDFFSTIHTIPTPPEQKKIANFLSAIDSKIEELNKELKINKEFKKGLLQQMFC